MFKLFTERNIRITLAVNVGLVLFMLVMSFR